jgi:probable F420-dependent oxidoreductase
MKFGFFGINVAVFSEPDAIVRVARTAESAGYESIWTGEHVVLIDPQEAPSPSPPETRMVDTVAALAFAAAHTERVKLGSGIILLAQRNPVVLAKELASVDVLSKGRLIFGVGVGYVPGEFEAIGVPYEERGARTSEHIEAIRALWTQDKPEFEGRFSSFSGIQSHPRPVQQPHPPILVGGMSPPAYRRAVAHGDGWYGFFQSLEATAEALRGLEEAAKQVERPAHLGPLQITITPPAGEIDADLAKRYEDLGVSRLVLVRGFKDMGRKPNRAAQDEVIAFLERSAQGLGLG